MCPNTQDIYVHHSSLTAISGIVPLEACCWHTVEAAKLAVQHRMQHGKLQSTPQQTA